VSGHVHFIAVPVRSLVCLCDESYVPEQPCALRVRAALRIVVTCARHDDTFSVTEKNFQLKLSFGRKDVFDATHQSVF